MGWPLVVSAVLMERRRRAMPRALAMLGAGHFLAMLMVLLPVSLLAFVVEWQRGLRMAAGFVVMAMGLYLVNNRRHPRMLAGVPPGRLALWSFLAATAHGAGLMIVPIFLGMAPQGHDSMAGAADGTVGLAFLVALVHTSVMSVAGGAVAVAVYAWFGLRMLSRGWFNLDLAWAVSLILVGGFGVYAAVGR